MASETDSDALSPRLRSVCESIRKHFARTARDDIGSRYQVGVLVSDVKLADDKYGRHAVGHLARALGTNMHTLYRCASVAECWSAPQIETLQRRARERGQSLSWSHLVLISGVASPRRRAELTERVLGEALSVRDLAACVRALSQDVAGTSRGRSALHRLIRAGEVWSESSARLQAAIVACLEGAATDRARAGRVIDRAIEAQEELRRVVESQLDRLRAEKARGDRDQR